MKKLFLILMAFTWSVFFSQPTALAASAEKSARLAHALTEGSPYDIGAKKFAELAAEYTNNEVNIRIYPNAQLGLEQATAKDVQLGLIEMTLVATNNASMWFPPLDTLILPFIFRDRDHVNQIVDGPVGKKLFDEYRDASGLRVISVLEWGDRGIINSKRPIEQPSDLNGLKLRVPKNDVMVDTYSALGATPTAIDWGELYAALQQGVADGLEGPPPGMIDMKFTDFLKYYSYVPVFHGLAAIFINESWFQGLTEAQQEAVIRAGREAGSYQRQISAEAHNGALERMGALGVNVNVIEDLTPFTDLVKPVIDKYRGVIGAQWITAIQDEGK